MGSISTCILSTYEFSKTKQIKKTNASGIDRLTFLTEGQPSRKTGWLLKHNHNKILTPPSLWVPLLSSINLRTARNARIILVPKIGGAPNQGSEKFSGPPFYLPGRNPSQEMSDVPNLLFISFHLSKYFSLDKMSDDTNIK